MNISSELSQKIRNMSLVCSMLVVVIHVGWGGATTPSQFMRVLLKDGLAQAAVPFFFALSGYLLAGHFNESGWYGREVRKRLGSLVLPFFLWSVLALCAAVPVYVLSDCLAHRAFGSSVPLSHGRWIDFFGFNLCTFPWLIPLWYLRCLFFLVLLSPVLLCLVRRLGWTWIVITYLITVAFTGATSSMGTFDGWRGFFIFGLSFSGVFYFSVGIMIRMRGIDWMSRRVAVGTSMLTILFLVLRIYLDARFGTVPLVLDCVLLPTFLYSLWYFMPSKAWPIWLTSSAFAIYLSHRIFLFWSGNLLGGFGIPATMREFLQLVLGIALPVLLVTGLRRWMPKTAKFIFAGR